MTSCQQLLYSTNVQYTIVNSSDDPVTQLQMDYANASELNLDLRSESDISINNKELEAIKEETIESIPSTAHQERQISYKEPTPNVVNTKKTERKFENLDNLFENRMEFIKTIANNPLYVNENFAEPWKIVTVISEKLLDELAISAEKEINNSIGDRSFIEEFLRSEINI